MSYIELIIAGVELLQRGVVEGLALPAAKFMFPTLSPYVMNGIFPVVLVAPVTRFWFPTVSFVVVPDIDDIIAWH